jgi:hypothetical protein
LDFHLCRDPERSQRRIQLPHALYFDSLSAANVRAAVGQVVQLNRKPYIGLNVTLRNSGASQAVIDRGTLTFGSTVLKLVMESVAPAKWVYGDASKNSAPEFTFFAPIIIGKDETRQASLWFEVDTGGAKLFTDSTHSLTLRLYGDEAAEPVATRQFSLTVTATDVSNIYADGRELDTLPVYISH